MGAGWEAGLMGRKMGGWTPRDRCINKGMYARCVHACHAGHAGHAGTLPRTSLTLLMMASGHMSSPSSSWLNR
jgi:hypothetical protein